MYTKLIVIFALFGVATCQYPLCTDVTPTGTLNNVIINGCTPGQPCHLKVNTYKNITVDFTPHKSSSNLTMNTCVDIGGMPFRFPGIDPNGCNADYNINCPLVANTKYEYRNKLFVAPIFISPTITFKAELVDDSSNTIVCFLVDAEISN